MAIEWTPDLSVGIEFIDNQHKELFAKIKNLVVACNEKRGQEIIIETLQFLENYTIEHFGAEESAMQKHNYPEYPSHKSQHEEFKKDIRDLKKGIDKEIDRLFVADRVSNYLVNWLVLHIRKVDKALGAFLKGLLI